MEWLITPTWCEVCSSVVVLQIYSDDPYAMISWVDENIGAILDTLDASGRRRDTIVVFTSDHGDFNFHFNMCKKDLVLTDNLLHVPCMISWLGHLTPRKVDSTLVEQVDVMPTLLELCNVPIPFGCQGKSLVPLLRGETAKHKDVVYAEICPPNFRNPYKTYAEFIADWNNYHDKPGHAVSWTANFNVPGDFCKSIRTADWRYVWYADGFEELYDLRKDPGEEKNLAHDGTHDATRREMKSRLLEWNALSEDPLDRMWHERHANTYDKWK